ncbi:MAG: hypothetical protein KIT83_19565 [Bryobacterales bacterium]|nr:hypothetical protein [Bryobacterales bacterium]
MNWKIAFLMTAVVSMASAGTAAGILVVDGKTTELKYAYAYQVKGGVENKERDTFVVVSAQPLPESLISSDLEDVDLLEAGIRGLVFHIPAAPHGYRSAPYYTAHLRVPEARSGIALESIDPGHLPKLSDSHIEGHFKGQIPYSTIVPLDSRNSTYDVRIAADVIPFIEVPVPSTQDAAAAEKSAPGQAFLKFLEAAGTREFDKMADHTTAPLAQRLKDPYFWDSISNKWNYNLSQLTSLKLLNVTTTGDSAVLTATGIQVTTQSSTNSVYREDLEGKIWMQNVGGRWLVKKYIWRDARGISPPPPLPPPPPSRKPQQ